MLPRIPDKVYRRPVHGLRLRPGTLADQLEGDRPTLLVFLRHFGCPFCKEAVHDIRATIDKDPSFPPVLFFSQACPDEAVPFFEKHWPDARVVCDPDKEIYYAMGLRQGTFSQVWGLRVWTCSFRAFAKGNFIGRPVGDPWLMPGVFLVRGPEIIWSHEYEHQGDNPEWSKIPTYARRGSGDPAVTGEPEAPVHSGR
jgi:hypothetical protein